MVEVAEDSRFFAGAHGLLSRGSVVDPRELFYELRDSSRVFLLVGGRDGDDPTRNAVELGRELDRL